MSLFVCIKCNAIENTNCVNHYYGKERNTDKPNLSLMNMQIGDKNDNGEYGVGKGMLCSECNTGTWHNEFEKEYANENELELASYSKHNYITPADHEPNYIIVRDDSVRCGYRTRTKEELLKLTMRTYDKRKSNQVSTMLHYMLSQYPEIISTTIPKKYTISDKESRSVIEIELYKELANIKRQIKAANRKGDKVLANRLKEEYNELKKEL